MKQPFIILKSYMSESNLLKPIHFHHFLMQLWSCNDRPSDPSNTVCRWPRVCLFGPDHIVEVEKWRFLIPFSWNKRWGKGGPLKMRLVSNNKIIFHFHVCCSGMVGSLIIVILRFQVRKTFAGQRLCKLYKSSDFRSKWQRLQCLPVEVT